MSAWQPMWDKVLDANPITDAIALDLDYRNDRYRALDSGILVEKPWADIINNYSAPAGRTYFDSSGVLQTAAADEPVIEYDPVTGEKLGNRIWGSYTCLNQYSFSPTNAAWVTDGATSSAFGGSVGLFTPVRAASAGGAWNTLRFGSPANGAGTFSGASFVVKFVYMAGTSGRLRIKLRDTTLGVETRIAGTITGTKSVVGIAEAGGAAVLSDVSAGSGLRVIAVHFTPTTPTNAFTFGAGPDSATSGQDVVICGGCAYAASADLPLVNTGSSAVTIAAENQIIDGSVFSDMWNAGAGTLFIECRGTINAVALKAAGVEVIVDSASNKKYAVAYTSDPSATSLIIGANLNGYVRRVVYFRTVLPASLIARLKA